MKTKIPVHMYVHVLRGKDLFGEKRSVAVFFPLF